MSTVAECSVRNNTQVCWGWSVLHLFSAPQEVQLSIGFSVSDMEYACLYRLCVGTQASYYSPILSNASLRAVS